MAAAAEISPIGWRQTARWLWLAVCGFFILVVVASNVESIRYSVFDRQSFGKLGAQFTPDPADGRNVTVDQVEPQSPLARLGIRPGAHLRLDYNWNAMRIPLAGEQMNLTVIAPGAAMRHTVTVPRDEEMAVSSVGVQGIYAIAARLLLMASGLFIVWRGWRNSSLMLGMAFICASGGPPWFWPISPAAAPYWFHLVMNGWTMSSWLLLAFAIRYNTENARPLPVWQDRLWRVSVAFVVVCGTFFSFSDPAALLPFKQLILKWPTPILMLLAFYYLVRGWLGSNAETRTRYAMMLIALPVAFSGNSIYIVTDFFQFHDLPQWVAVATDIGRYVGPVLFAYAIFRHRVLDLGFAVNRALVYGVVSAILLVAFGLLEWMSEHVIPIQDREKNILVDAGIALAVFLTFHRVRDFVEHYIESWFFRSWHNNEAALKRFVAEAGFIGKPDALARAFVEELRRFSAGAACALYVRAENGDYRLSQGALPGAPATIDADDPASVALRARRTPQGLDGDGTSRLVAVLALPIVHRNNLQGFALLAAKPGGASYRPDEIELLGWAAHQVALDLHVLKVEELEQALAEHRQRESLLDAQLQIALKLGHLISVPAST